MSRSTRLDIDLGAISANIAVLREITVEQKLMAVVKANAYGHGAVAVSRHIESQVDALAVAFTEEAVTLREAGIAAPILVLEGPHAASDIALAAKLDLWPAIHQSQQFEWCQAHIADLSQIWIKVDTGMHRLGFELEELDSIRNKLSHAGGTDLTLMSHLAAAEHPDNALTTSQARRWSELTQRWDGQTSLNNSAATRSAMGYRSDWARVGYALYGGQIEGMAADDRLQPAMRLTSAVIAIRQVPAGDSVGYGGRWVAQRDSLIATVPVGYGDGYPWSAADGTPVSVAGQLAPLAGRVSMDMITVDVTDCADVEVGSMAVLWGDEPHIDEVARHCGTIGYELMTRFTRRTPVRYLNA